MQWTSRKPASNLSARLQTLYSWLSSALDWDGNRPVLATVGHESSAHRHIWNQASGNFCIVVPLSESSNTSKKTKISTKGEIKTNLG